MQFAEICEKIDENYTLKAIQEFCKELKIKVSGPKAEVIERIVTHLQQTPIECLDMNSSFVKIIRLVHRQISNNENGNHQIHPLPESPQHQHLKPMRSTTTTTRWLKIFGLIVLMFLLAIAVFAGINDISDLINGKKVECIYKRGWF